MITPIWLSASSFFYFVSHLLPGLSAKQRCGHAKPKIKNNYIPPMHQQVSNLHRNLISVLYFFHPPLFTLNCTQIFKLWIILKTLHGTCFLTISRSLEVFFILSGKHSSLCLAIPFSSCNACKSHLCYHLSMKSYW